MTFLSPARFPRLETGLACRTVSIPSVPSFRVFHPVVGGEAIGVLEEPDESDESDE